MVPRKLYDPGLVKTLGDSADDFVEILLDRFELRRDGPGVRLIVSLNDDAPAIGSSAGRRHVRSTIRDFEATAAAHRVELDRYLEAPAGAYSYYDPDFPLRYTSGGVLPLAEIDGRAYYCLIYRECFPVGWNLANGAAHDRVELLNPVITIERELREELVIVDRKYEQLGTFDFGSEHSPDATEHDMSLELWSKRLLGRGWTSILGFERTPVELDWLVGPDTVEVRYPGSPAALTRECYVNINPEDFGIEIDRIARMRLNNSTILCDGELLGDTLIGSVIGLFDVSRFNETLARGGREFFPDRFFYGGTSHSPVSAHSLLETIRDDFVPRMAQNAPDWDRGEWDVCEFKFDLCPVTRALVKRAAAR